MNRMEEIRAMLIDELDSFAGKGNLSSSDLEAIHMITSSIKSIDQIAYNDMYDARYSETRGRSSFRRY